MGRLARRLHGHRAGGPRRPDTLRSDKGRSAGLALASTGPPGAPAVRLAISARYSQDSWAPPTVPFAHRTGGGRKRAGGGPKQPPATRCGASYPGAPTVHQNRAGQGRQKARLGSSGTDREGPWVQAQCSVGLHTAGRAQLCPGASSGLVRLSMGTIWRGAKAFPTDADTRKGHTVSAAACVPQSTFGPTTSPCPRQDGSGSKKWQEQPRVPWQGGGQGHEAQTQPR